MDQSQRFPAEGPGHDGLPPPGWYADPADDRRSRFWDGARWTDRTAARPMGWDAGSGWPPSDAAAPLGTYTPDPGPLAPSGMRRLDGLFADIGRILRRGWWRIAAAALLIWTVWGGAALLLAVFVVDVTRLVDAVAFAIEATQGQGSGPLPPDVAGEVDQRFTEALAAAEPARWIAAGIVLAAATALAASSQTAAVARIGMDAAAGLPLSLSLGLKSGLIGGFRLLGYSVLLAAAAVALIGSAAAATWAAAAVSAWLAAVVGLLSAAGFAVLGVWIGTRIVPFAAEAVLTRGALGWAWRATRGKFWAVLGRWLVWSVVASVGIQLLSGVLLAPLSLVTGLAAGSGDPASAGWAAAVFVMVSIPVGIVLNSAALLGVVPIWRDLTTRSEYRAIEAGAPRSPPP